MTRRSASGIPLPNEATAIALASIAVHADEATSHRAHEFDVVAIRGLLDSPGVQTYLAVLDKYALLPVKR